MTEAPNKDRHTFRRHLPALALLAAVTLLVLAPMFPPWNLATHLHGGDAHLFAYLHSWGARTLWTRPWEYQHIPLFHPMPGMRAHTETNTLLELMGGPAALLGNPVLEYNLACLTAALLTAASGYWLCWLHTRSRAAAVVGGLLLSTNGWMVWHLWGHPNIACAFPMLLGFACWTRGREGNHAGWFGAAAGCMVAQFLASIYLGVVMCIGLSGLWMWDAGSRRTAPWRRELRLLAPFAAAVVCAWLIALPHQRLGERLGSTRGLDQAAFFAASPSGYLFPARWEGGPRTLAGVVLQDHASLPRQRLEDNLFAGWIGLVLAALGAGEALLRRRRPRNGLALAGAAGLVLSLGPWLWWGERLTGVPLPFRLVHEWCEPLRFFRATARFGVLALVAVGVAASMGTALLLARFRGRGSRLAACGALLGLVALELSPLSPPATTPLPLDAREALLRLPPGTVLAPHPFGDERWLPILAGTPLRTPSGTDVGATNHRYRLLREAMVGRLDRRLAARHAALGVRYILAWEEPVPGTHLREVARFEDGRLLEVVTPADREFAAWIDSRPERPVVELPRSQPPGFRALDPVRWIAADSHGEWAEAAPPTFVHRGLDTSIGIVLGGVPLSELGEVAVTLRHSAVGLDWTEARMRWITDARPELSTAPVVTAIIDGGGGIQTVVFDLSASPAYNPAERVQALFLSAPGGTYPGLELAIEAVGARRHSG